MLWDGSVPVGSVCRSVCSSDLPWLSWNKRFYLKSAALSREQRGNFVKTFKFCDFEVFIPKALKLSVWFWVNVLAQFHVCSENKIERSRQGVGSMVEASGIGEHLFDLWKVLEGTFWMTCVQKLRIYIRKESWNGMELICIQLCGLLLCVCVCVCVYVCVI